VRALDPDRRAVVGLRFWLDWSLEQISEALDVPAGTVSSRLTRALAELGLGAPAIAALDRVDFKDRFVVFAVRRNRGLVVRKLKLRPVRGGLQLCIYFRDRNTGTDGQLFGYDIVSVRKTGPLQQLGTQLAATGVVLFDGKGKLVRDGPLGRLRPALCR
jgi:hypothetical protein